MVDVRPLLFINALALMLLVTAGFASVREELTGTTANTQQAPALSKAIATANREDDRVFLEDKPAQAPAQQSHQIKAKPFVIGTVAEEPQSEKLQSEPPQLLALAEPTAAMRPTVSDVTPAQPEPAPPARTTGTLVLRSNVVGDQVSVNGKDYGATRLDLELKPGTYDVVIRKQGYQPWQRTVALDAGDETTLTGQLEANTRVNYRDGAWVGGVKTGDGTLQNSQGLRYEGHFVDGQFHGQGTAWYPDGSRYQGDWRSGQRHGEGNWRGPDDSRYTGQFRNDQFSGQGTLTLASGDILTGQWAEGRLNGHGSLTTSDGMLYVGGFRNDDFHGEGTLTYPDGRLYEGEFSNGEFHGKGKEVFADGKQYDGQYIEGSFHGQGLLSNPNGSSIQATFRFGEPYGKVRLTTAAGEVFTARTTEPGVCYRDKSYRATQCPNLEGW